jgi:hypothetical protein
VIYISMIPFYPRALVFHQLSIFLSHALLVYLRSTSFFCLLLYTLCISPYPCFSISPIFSFSLFIFSPHFILFCPILLSLFPFYCLLSHSIHSCPILFTLFPFYCLFSHCILSCPILFSLVPFYSLLSHFILSCPILLSLFPFYSLLSHFIVSFPIY